jgi:hypothetical protein
MKDLTELLKLCDSATPGPWDTGDELTRVFVGEGDERFAVAYTDSDILGFKEAQANANFIAALPPSTIASLIRRLQMAEKVADAAHKFLIYEHEEHRTDLDEAVTDWLKEREAQKPLGTVGEVF